MLKSLLHNQVIISCKAKLEAIHVQHPPHSRIGM